MYIKRSVENRTEMYKEEKCGMWAGSTIGVLVMCLIQGGKEGEVREDKEK